MEDSEPFTYTCKAGNEGGRTTYNRFLNPGGLLWLAEVPGESEEILKQAAEASAEVVEAQHLLMLPH